MAAIKSLCNGAVAQVKITTNISSCFFTQGLS